MSEAVCKFTETYGYMAIGTERKTDTQRPRQTELKREKERHRETEKDRHAETETHS